jgi:hypothetical protein
MYFWSLFINFYRDLHVLVVRLGFLDKAFILKVMLAKIIVTVLAKVRMHFKLFPA